MALRVIRKLIGKETDKDLIDEIKTNFDKMASAKTIEQFLTAGNYALKALERLKSGNEKTTGRVWTGAIWGFIETSIKSAKSESGKMMAVLKNADKANSWYEKLNIYCDSTMINDNYISSRWNKDVRDSAGKALEHIKDLVNETFGKNPKDIENPNLLIENMANFFCTEGEKLTVKCGGSEISSINSAKNSVSLLPLNNKILNTYGGEVFYKIIKKACGLGPKATLEVNDKTITSKMPEGLSDKDKIIGLITDDVIEVLKSMTTDGVNKVDNLTTAIVTNIENKVKAIKNPQNAAKN